MGVIGSRSRSIDVWLTTDDEASFDARLRNLQPEAFWRCSQPGPAGLHQVHLHPTLRDALRCGGTQAFLPLPFGASLPPIVGLATGLSKPTGPLLRAEVQLVESRLIDNESELVYRCGRLATKWYEREVGAAMHRVLVDQTDIVWTTLIAATQPARVTEPSGHVTSVGRIGDHARSVVIEREIPLARSGFHRYRLVDSPTRAHAR